MAYKFSCCEEWSSNEAVAQQDFYSDSVAIHVSINALWKYHEDQL